MPAREDVLGNPGIGPVREAATDRVDESEAVGLQDALDELTERPEVGQAHMFQHANRNEYIAALIDRAVVVLDERHTVVQPHCRCAFFRVRDLFPGVVVGAYLDAVMLCHVQGQRAPAAACLDDSLPRLELQLPAHVIELRDLRLVQCGGRCVVVGAGVHHALIQPQLVEIVAEVIVVMHVVPRAAERIGPHRVQQGT